MIKDYLIYCLLLGLQIGGHYFFIDFFPQEWLDDDQLLKMHIFIWFLFLSSHTITVTIPKFTSLILGQVFLGFTVVKFLAGGSYLLLLRMKFDFPLDKYFVVFFMSVYFVYLFTELFLMIGHLRKTTQ